MNALRPMLAALLLMGCNTAIALTDGGNRVQTGGLNDMPAGCRLLSDVRIGIPPDAAMPSSEDELVILMRNKTHEQGGNWVVVESVQQRDTNDDGEVFYRGRGTSYRCPEEAESAGIEESNDDGAPPPEETSGGEDTGGGGGSGDSSEDDDMLEDLLGE